MKALLKNYHQPPRKVRLVADLIRGKSVPAARAALTYLSKKSAPAMEKLLNSAVANARTAGFSAEQLFVKTVTVNKGAVMRRYRPFARGRSGVLHKEMSIVALELAPSEARTKGAAAADGGLPLTGRGAKKTTKKATKPRAKKVAAKAK